MSASEVLASAVVGDGQAAAELIRRRRARRSLLEYARSVDIPGAPVGADVDPETEVFATVESKMVLHHRIMLEKIEACVLKPRGRLIIQAPPGSAKTSYVSVVTPAHFMSRFKNFQTILASYGVDQAVKPSRRARALCRQPKHTSIFPNASLNNDQRAADEWKLANGSEFLACGFQSGITGNRADLLLVDDPVKNREDADSPTMREKVANEFRDSAKTRLKPTASIIIIMTRWHEDDLVGGILPENYAGESGPILCRDGQVWEVLNIPAEAEHPDDPLGRQPGEYLWPEWFPPEHWLEFKNDPKGQRTWSALFQQRPSPLEGLQFVRAKCRWYDPDVPIGALPPPGTPGYGSEDKPCGPPVVVRQYGASDYATKDEADAKGPGDFTEHGVIGLDSKSNMIFRDWWSGRRETDKSILAFNDLVAKHRTDPDSAFPIVYWWNEGGTIDRAIRPAINRSMREYDSGNAFVTIETLPSIQDKGIKLLSFHARYNAGYVYLPIRRDWAQKVLEQLLKFPTGKHDDKADVCGLLGRGIDKMGVTALPSESERPAGVKLFTEAWFTFEEPKEPKVRYF